ncbi:hypothetical protein [Photobacterium carnosum]|uniref:hypothetical protein n=1 Tax=Photobacterium carnosum TaxID=2023717 RepID=UPI001E643130|nr:hypothetical protein [Photobacterium carnosum]MCD9527320.1 hypothetical protein [Photobacterium carnosum]MCD9536081.1 hypothetical protein [Photobacterium carnosum]MCF2161443.1 hypothetical protein [Photobacterium carnosum]
MSKFIYPFLAGILLLATLSGCNSIPKETSNHWVKLATKTANFQTDTDTVTINSLFNSAHYNHLKLTCIQGTVQIDAIKINYADGHVQQLSTLGLLTKNSSTRAMTLDRAQNKIKSIELTYNSIGNATLNLAGVTKKAKLEIWAKKTADTNN